VLGHPQERARDEVVGLDRDDVVFRQVGDARRDRPALEDRRSSEVHAGQQADAPAVAHEHGVDLVGAHRLAGALDRRVGRDKNRGMEWRVAHPRAEQRAEARRLLVARRRFELARDLAIEEGGEAVVMGDELQDQVARRKVAQRLFARDESLRSAALDQGAAVETIAGAAQSHHLVAVALLDAALDDDEQRVRRAVARDQRLAGAEVADVERPLDRGGFLWRQPVEWRVGRVERLRHRSAAPRPMLVDAGFSGFLGQGILAERPPSACRRARRARPARQRLVLAELRWWIMRGRRPRLQVRPPLSLTLCAASWISRMPLSERPMRAGCVKGFRALLPSACL